MNYLLLYIAAITLFSSINAMDYPSRTPFLWAITTDEQCVEIDEAITQQSNLLTVLQKAGVGTQENPIPIKVSKDDFDFFCSCLTSPAQQLLADLNDGNYSKLMDVAEILKCPIFYAELMEQLLHGNDLSNRFAREQIKTVKLKKAVYKQCRKKKCIKRSKRNRNSSLFLLYSPDGNYFVENSSTNTIKAEINLWDTRTLTCIATFPEYLSAQFSPNSDYVILYSNKEGDTPIDIPLLFSITHKKKITLLDDHQNYIGYTPILSPNGRYIIQQLQGTDYRWRYTLLGHNTQENTIQRIPFEDDWARVNALHFCPDGKHMLYLTTDGNLIRWELNNPHNKKEIGKNLTDYYTITSNGSLLFLSNRNTIKVFTIKENAITYIQELSSSAHKGIKSMLYPYKNIVFYSHDNSTICGVDMQGNQKASHKLKNDAAQSWITKLVGDHAGNYLASCYDWSDHSQELMRSTVILWDLSDITTRIPGVKIDMQTRIKHMAFTKDGFLVTQGDNKTELWDMDGDKILSLGTSDCFALHPHTNSILTAYCALHCPPNNWGIPASQPRLSKIWLSQINTQSAQTTLEDIKKSLTLQNALLFNAHYAHTKKPNTTKKKQLHRNMPDGRAFVSLKQEHTFLTKNFKLAKDPFIPKTLSISQPEKPPYSIQKKETS